ncbi:MAG: hypothetical protein AAF696_15570 [Bacteroidota bacterium]
MKKLSNLLIALICLGAIFVGCEEDPIPPSANGPTIAVNSGTSEVIDAATVAVNTVFSVDIITTAGDVDITQIEIEENSSLIDAGRITLDGSAAGGNPSPIGANFASGFNWTIGITTSDQVDVVNTYTIRITDADGLSDELSVDITQIASVSEETMVLLLNQGGPAGTGGVDLDTGTGTGTRETTDANGNIDSSYVNAELRDMGIDVDGNWLKKVGVINNSQLVVPAAGFDYDAVVSINELVSAFEAGTEVQESEVVTIGNTFIVKNEFGKHFAVKVTDLTETPNDNSDFYTLSVKQ